MKSNKLTKLIILLMAIIMMLSFVGCGKDDGSEKDAAPSETAKVSQETSSDSILEGETISFMTSQAKFFTAYETMAEKIQEDYGCVVEFQVVPDNEYTSLIKVKLNTSEVPDVFEMNAPSENTTYGIRDYCEDLSEEAWVSRLVNPELLKDSVNGKIYQLPKESSSGYQGVYYNKEVLENCGITDPNPKTYAEFLDILETIKTKGNGVTPFYQTNADTWTTQIFMTGGIAVALGDKAVEVTDQLKANEIKWTDIPEAAGTLQSYVDLYDLGYINDDNASVGYDTAAEAICTGKAAMYLTIEQWAADAIKKYPDCELGSFIIPHNDHAILPTGTYVQGLSVPSAGKHVDVTKAFLEVWSLPEYQNLYYQENPGFPAWNDVDGGDVAGVVKNLVDNYINTGEYVYEFNSLMAVSAAINTDMWNYFIEAINGEKTPDEVYEKIQSDYIDYMQQEGADGF